MWGIKTVGLAVLGKEYTESTGKMPISQALSEFPLLRTDKTGGVLSEGDILNGLSRVHYLHNDESLQNITCVLPGETSNHLPVPLSNRIPIYRMRMDKIPLAPEEQMAQVAADSYLWNSLALYLGLYKPNVHPYSHDEFVNLARKSNTLLFPFSLKEELFNFWITDLGQNVHLDTELSGKIRIQSAAVLQGSSPGHPSRTIISTVFDRIWSAESLKIWQRLVVDSNRV